MPFRELSALSREAFLREQIRQLKVVYGSKQRQLQVLLQSIELTDFGRSRAEAILRQVNQIVGVLDTKAYSWAKDAIPDSYIRGVDLAAERLKALGVTRFVNPNAQIHTSAVSILIDDVAIGLIQANQSIKGLFNRYIRQTQQRLIEDAEISKRIAEGVAGGETRRTVSDVILKDLRAKMRNQQFVVINGRNYRPDAYAELVARTRTREATTQGSINTSLRYGVDLVQWDAHSEVCPYCAQFSGRVYSISGTSKDFPILNEKPPAHPNCRCVIVPVTMATLERRGYLQEIIKLSNSPLIPVDSFHRFEEVLSEL